MYAIDVFKSIDYEFQNIKEEAELWPQHMVNLGNCF